MKIAVIGAGGFIGRHLVSLLQESGDEVLAFSLHGTTASGLPVEPLDILRAAPVFPASLDGVVYLSQSPHYRRFPEKATDLFGVNTWGAIRAAEAAHAAGARFFLYASTGNVYAPSYEPLSENAPLNRAQPYSLSKIAAEEALALFAPNLAVCCMRIFGAFGPGQTAMLPVALRDRIRKKTPITLQQAQGETPATTGGLRISFSYVGDVVRQIRGLAKKACDKESIPLHINLGGAEAISIRQFSIALGSALGIEPVFQLDAIERPFDLIADVKQLQNTLAPHVTPFQEAMTLSYATATDATG